MNEPVTETGRNLLHPDTLVALGLSSLGVAVLQEAVDAIETEARNAALDEVAAKVEALRKLDDWGVVVRRDAMLAIIEEVRR